MKQLINNKCISAAIVVFMIIAAMVFSGTYESYIRNVSTGQKADRFTLTF